MGDYIFSVLESTNSSNIALRVFDSDMTLLWTKTASSVSTRISVYGDDKGNVYVGGMDNNQTVRKFDSQGNLLWSYNMGRIVHDIAIDIKNDYHVYVFAEYWWARVDEDGNEVWRNTNVNVDAARVIEVDEDSIFIGGAGNPASTDTGPHVAKHNKTGALHSSIIWENTIGALVHSLIPNGSGGCFTAGAANTSQNDVSYRKFNSNGTEDLNWRGSFSGFAVEARAVTIGPNDDVFVHSHAPSQLRRVNRSNGNTVWTLSQFPPVTLTFVPFNNLIGFSGFVYKIHGTEGIHIIDVDNQVTEELHVIDSDDNFRYLGISELSGTPIQIWNGSSWEQASAMYTWDGSSWVTIQGLKTWNGSQWE